MTLVFIASRLENPGNGSQPATFDFYIGPSGNDTTGDGSQGNPWAITALNSKASTIAGKRVGLLDGTHRITSGGDNNTYLLDMPSGASGSSGAHTVIESVNARQATITTNNGSGVYPQGGADTGALATIFVNADWVDFKNIVFGPTGGHGLVPLSANNCLIEGCWFKDMYAKRKTNTTDDNLGAIYTKTQAIDKSNITVRNCLFEDIYALSQVIGMNDSCGIGSMFGAKTWVIEYCTFRRMGKAAFYKGQTENITFRYNVVEECSGFVQGAMSANSSTTSSNYIYGCLARVNWCFGQNSSNTQGDAADVFEMFNNTIIMDEIESGNDCDFGYMVMMGGSNGQALKFYNNAIYLNPAFGLGPGMFYFPAGTEALSTRIDLWDYNRYSKLNIEDNVGSASYNTLAAWAATGRDTHSPAVGTLGLVNQSGSTLADFRPGGGSALTNGGTIDGLSGSTACDIGWTRYATIGHDW